MPNWNSPTFLTSTERDGIRADLAAIMDESTGATASVIYVHRDESGSAVYNPVTGLVTDGTVKETVTVLVGTPTDQDAKDAGIVLEATDRKFLIDINDLSGSDPITGDVIVHANTTYEITNVRSHEVSNVVVALASVLGGAA